MSVITKVLNYSVKNAVAVNKEIFAMRYMPRNLNEGIKQGARLSKIKHSSVTQTVVNKGLGAYRKGVYPHIPGVLAGICAILPFPGTTVGGFCLGKFIQKIIKNGIRLKK